MAEELFGLSAERKEQFLRMLDWFQNLRGDGVINSPVSGPSFAQVAGVRIGSTPAPEVVAQRWKITTAASPGQPTVGLAKRWDGTTAAGTETPIRLVRTHAVNDIIYAVRVRGNTDQTYNSAPVRWLELVTPPWVMYRVALTQTGGSTGTKTTAASWTYTAALDGVTVGTNLAPEWTRPNGTMTAGGAGLGYFTADGSFLLSVAFERPGTGACP